MAHLVIHEMHEFELSINTASTGTATYKALAAGIDNMQEQLNEVVQQYKFMADDGFSRSRVTGMAPVWTLTGRRVHGDDAQDFIFSKKYGVGANRQTDAKVTCPDGSTITFDCTFCNLQEISGATEEDAAISIEVHVDGKPTITPAGD